MCYQLPAIIEEALTVVVSPLIALMRDQVRQMRAQWQFRLDYQCFTRG
jgi:ATP-dependent DNA helicase RecQ